MRTIRLNRRSYGRAQVLGAIGAERTACTKALAILALDAGLVELNDLKRYVPNVEKLLPEWREDTAVTRYFEAEPVAKPISETIDLSEGYIIHRGNTYTKAQILGLAREARITMMSKAVILLAIGKEIITNAELIKVSRHLNVQTLQSWRKEADVSMAMMAEARQPRLKDLEADRLFSQA